ncbi:MAG: segregation and condensation protein A [Candidatus Acidiferrales bacterium]
MAFPASAASLPRLEPFDGPLDLLLDEVRRQNVAIERVAMAPLVARFFDYFRNAAAGNLNLGIEWLHTAAVLILWKSRALLPPEACAEPSADPVRDRIVEQLLAYRKHLAAALAQRQAAAAERFSRTEEGEFRKEPARDGPEAAPFVSLWDLLQQARELAVWVREHRQARRSFRRSFDVSSDNVTAAQMADYLRTQLAPGAKIDGTSLLHAQPSADRRSCLFLGMLELARDHALEIEQQEPFAAIWLSPLQYSQ